VVRGWLVRLRVHGATVLVLVFTRRRQMVPRLVHPLVLARRRRQQSDVAHARVVRFRVGGSLSSAGVRRALCLGAGNIPGCLYNVMLRKLRYCSNRSIQYARLERPICGLQLRTGSSSTDSRHLI